MRNTSIKRIKKASGFTLVELLVVVSIIAILSVIGLTLFNGAQQNARDARRKADIDAIAKVLETGRNPGTVYYLSLSEAGFSGGVVPTDTTTAKYNIMTSTAAGPIGKPTAWASTVVSPTAPGGAVAPLSSWTSIPSGGLGVGTAASTQPFVANTISWIVCARLEASDASGASLQVYCKNSAQ